MSFKSLFTSGFSRCRPWYSSRNAKACAKLQLFQALLLSSCLHALVLYVLVPSASRLLAAGGPGAPRDAPFLPVLIAEIKPVSGLNLLSLEDTRIAAEKSSNDDVHERSGVFAVLPGKENAGMESLVKPAASPDSGLVNAAAAMADEGEAQRSVEPSPGLPPAPGYLNAAQLDPPPEFLTNVVLKYPDAAGAQEGRVILRILINETGEIADLAVVHANPVGFFEVAALSAFAQARFSPGRRFGKPVKSQLTIEVLFKPFNRGANVSGKGY